MAYIVGDPLGLKKGDYSFTYVIRWAGGDVDYLVKQSAERGVSCAEEVLRPLEATPDRVSTSDTRKDIISP